MPREQFSAIENNFTKGLITEASGLNFPENSLFDADNITIKNDGSISRRYGIDWEASGMTKVVTRNGYAITEFVWENVAGQGELTFVVVQIGPTLYFYELDSTGVVSTNAKTFTVLLTDFDLATPDAYECQYASGAGKLFVFNPVCEPFYIEYNVTGDTISTTQINLKTRDFEGVVDTVTSVDERPAALTDAHEYNLYNQGWFTSAFLESSTSVGNVLTNWDSLRADFPSNADVWWINKDSDEAFAMGMIDRFVRGNTPAPKGHFILNTFNTDRSGAHAAIGTVTETTAGNNRPTTGAFYAGRVWYAGVNADGYSSKIYFSQIIEQDEQIGLCYQQNDPTSEELFDLLPSDGGVIPISEAGVITKLIPIQEFLLVFATNGVWSIAGSEGIGFKATDYAVTKITNVGLLNALSLIIVEGFPVWWNTNGIWGLTPVPTGGGFEVKSLSDQTIQSFFLTDIPEISKKYAKSAYNPLTKTIRWIYSSESPTTVDEQYTYDRMLNFNLNFGAFYPWSLTTESVPVVNGIISANNTLAASSDDNLFLFTTTEFSGGLSYDLGFSKEYKTDYFDWTDEDYDSFFTTGYKLHSEGFKKFQSNFIFVFTKYISNNSCLFKTIWDYANSGNSGRVTQTQEVCKSDFYTDVQIVRRKIRGSGLTAQLNFSSVGNAPFHVVGWSTYETRNAGP